MNHFLPLITVFLLNGCSKGEAFCQLLSANGIRVNLVNLCQFKRSDHSISQWIRIVIFLTFVENYWISSVMALNNSPVNITSQVFESSTSGADAITTDITRSKTFLTLVYIIIALALVGLIILMIMVCLSIYKNITTRTESKTTHRLKTNSNWSQISITLNSFNHFFTHRVQQYRQ